MPLLQAFGPEGRLGRERNPPEWGEWFHFHVQQSAGPRWFPLWGEDLLLVEPEELPPVGFHPIAGQRKWGHHGSIPAGPAFFLSS